MHSIIVYLKNKEDRYVSRPYSFVELCKLAQDLEKDKFVYIWLGGESQLVIPVADILNLVFVPYVEPPSASTVQE